MESTALPQLVVEAALQNWMQAGKQSVFGVRGNSMHPFLHPGDTILILHSRCEDAVPGELIAFRSGKTLIVHRLLRFITDGSSSFFLCKGDNCSRPDPLVPAERIVGRACAVIRGKSKVRLEAPAWRAASRAIAACARCSLILDRWKSHHRRRFAYSRFNPILAFLYNLVVKLLSLPDRALSRVMWWRQ